MTLRRPLRSCSSMTLSAGHPPFQPRSHGGSFHSLLLIAGAAEKFPPPVRLAASGTQFTIIIIEIGKNFLS